MPRFFVAARKYSPWLCVDSDPGDPGADVGGGGSGGAPDSAGSLSIEELQAQLSELQTKTQGQDSLITKLRGIERQHKSMEAILGETNPERLQQLRDAEAELQKQQSTREQAVIDARNEVATEKKEEIDHLNKQLSVAKNESAQIQTKFELFQAFNANGGIGSRFEAFLNLASNNFERDSQKHLQVRDDQGKLVVISDDKGDRAATPADFIKMLGSGDLEGYQFNQMQMLQLTLEAYNKASGSGLPRDNGYNVTKPLSEMSKEELAKAAFG